MLVTKVGPSVALNDALRDAHESLAETIKTEIEKRKEKGIPLDDDTDFEAVARLGSEIKMHAGTMASAEVRERAGRVLAMCSGGLQELGEFAPNPDYDGVTIAMRSVSERQRISTREAVSAAKTAAERHDVFAEYVSRAVAFVYGLSDEDGAIGISGGDDGKIPPEQMEILDLAGMVPDLWAAARHYAELPASKKKHFGSPRQSPLETLTAVDAQPARASG